MSEHKLVNAREYYEAALMRFQNHVKPNEDGTFRLEVEDGASIGIAPALFQAFKDSLEITNTKIKRGELDPNDVKYINY